MKEVDETTSNSPSWGSDNDMTAAEVNGAQTLNNSTSEVWFDSDPNLQFDEFASLAAPLPDTPLKPPTKKVKRTDAGSRESGEILDAIRELSEKHDDTFRSISDIKRATEATSKQLEKLTSTVQQLTLDVNQQKQGLVNVEKVVQKLQEENQALKAEIAECQRYSRRWSLKIHGVKEDEGEDIRRKIVDILGKTAPKTRQSLENGIDIVHRVGRRRQDGSNRSTIVLFAMRRLRDAVWRDAKGSKFLLENRLRITEALSPGDKAAREKLWPIVQKAREEGKKASFRGPFIFIDGKKVDPSEVT